MAAPPESPPPPVSGSGALVANANLNRNENTCDGIEVLGIRDVPDYTQLSCSFSLSSLRRRDTRRTTSTSTGSSSASDIGVSTSSLPVSSSASARSSSIRMGGSGGGIGRRSGGTGTPFIWVSATKPAVMPVSVDAICVYVSGSPSSLKKGTHLTHHLASFFFFAS